ncbi:MAG: HepT-like ribonuclease domain-containing protein [Thermomicrobiales bacterium]
MKIQTAKRLLDALIASSELVQLTGGQDIDWYRGVRLHKLACERLLEIVGEALGAAAEIDPRLREDYPEIRQAIGMRHRIIHGYDRLDDQIIWQTLVEDIPPLCITLETLLKDAPPA